MKKTKLVLDDEESEDITIGLLRLAKPVPETEFLYHLNLVNSFLFSRIEDLVWEDSYTKYSFSRYQAYATESKSCLHLISNKPIEKKTIREQNELFVQDEISNHLLTDYEDVDYLIKSEDSIHDFSLILLPELLAFPIQTLILKQGNTLHNLFHYYE